MEKRKQLLKRLDDIGVSLQATPHALALIGLGSCGVELERLDNFSDLDFFVIVEDGYKQQFINNLTWLSAVHPLTYIFKNTADGYKILYQDAIYCEFAVFEVPELEKAAYNEGRIVWCTDSFNQALRIPKHTGAPEWKPESADWLIGETITCLYVGLCRMHRGEKLSGYTFVQKHAFNTLLELICLTEQPAPVLEDIYTKDRRFELRFPHVANELPNWLQGFDRITASAEAQLCYLEKHYQVAPAMAAAIRELCR